MNKEISNNNKLVIIGNGFDLAHGLNTRYSDFINSVITELFLNYSDQKSSSCPFYEVNKKLPRFLYDEIDSFMKSISSITGDGLIVWKNKYFSNLIQDTFHLQDFKWVNIEKHFFDKLVWYFNQGSNIEVKELNNNLNALILEFEKYLLDEMKHTEIKLNNYIENIILPEYIYRPLRIKLNDENLNITPIHVLNFNYTSTFELYARSSGMEINQIHGKLNDTTNPMIFGYGDETDHYYKKIEDTGNNDYLKNFKSFGYFKTENYQRLLRFLDFDKYDVLIMGHSCGLSDRVMLKTIFEHKNCEEIQIFYHQKGEDTWDNDFVEKTMEISRHFSDKAQMRKKVRPFNLSTPLTPYKPEK